MNERCPVGLVTVSSV